LVNTLGVDSFRHAFIYNLLNQVFSIALSVIAMVAARIEVELFFGALTVTRVTGLYVSRNILLLITEQEFNSTAFVGSIHSSLSIVYIPFMHQEERMSRVILDTTTAISQVLDFLLHSLLDSVFLMH
jgi:exosortase/archaeosortase